ncbi:hypothetical protein SAMN05446037_100635 [Anaerovirgula multivorans]|uniref:Uncharacterized protein n=1 Tax=Anaerovirgula multivorans TaxID=312168 RepID=A0A239CNR3_9FIRM|nr:hypothetical protein [Anaerovirgula multivorans]SNS20983.1 hypothetical protein SAMN05446037_100635 [Anaerovirgula multivorans]
MSNRAKIIKDLAEEEIICEYCICTDYGRARVNTGPWNLCEGRACDEAYENYLANVGEDEDE